MLVKNLQIRGRNQDCQRPIWYQITRISQVLKGNFLISTEDYKKENTELRKKCLELTQKVSFLEEKNKADSIWKKSSVDQFSESNKRLKQNQCYIASLETKLRESLNALSITKEKLKISEAKLNEAKIYLHKAKAIIENNELIIETYRSNNHRILSGFSSLYMEEKAKILSLRYVELTNDFIPVLNQIIRANPSIEILDLEGNLISDKGALLISEIISGCPGRLHTINLEFNQISGNGAWELLKAISVRDSRPKVSSKISSIALSYNKFENYNELYIKVWECLQESGIDIKSIIDKKNLLTASTQIVARVFTQICENYEKSEIKEIISALQRVHVENGLKRIDLEMEVKEVDFNDISHIESVGSFFNENSILFEKSIENRGFAIEHGSVIQTVNIEETFKKGLQNYSKIVDKLLESGVSVNAIDPVLHETMLMAAVKNKNLALVQYLIKCGADIDIPSVKSI